MIGEFKIEPFDLFEESWKKEEDVEPEERVWTVYVHIVPKELVEEDHDMYYVGVTSGDAKDRWKYNGNGYKNQPFGKIIRDVGWNNIYHEIIAEHLTIEEASDLEHDLVDKLHCLGEHGYNKRQGGISKNFSKAISEDRHKKYVMNNKVEFYGDYVKILYYDYYALFDLEDYNKLLKYSIKIEPTRNGSSFRCRYYDSSTGKTQSVKNILFGKTDELIIHLNGDSLDFRRDNILLASTPIWEFYNQLMNNKDNEDYLIRSCKSKSTIRYCVCPYVYKKNNLDIKVNHYYDIYEARRERNRIINIIAKKYDFLKQISVQYYPYNENLKGSV